MFQDGIVLVLIVASFAAYAQDEVPLTVDQTEISAANPLDGLQFIAGIVRDGEDLNSPLEDRLIFSGGKFSSAVCQRYNFVSAPYWIRLEGTRIHFLAELSSPTDGTMVWKGTIENGKLEGTMRWTRARWYWTVDAEHKIRGEVDTAAQQPPKD